MMSREKKEKEEYIIFIIILGCGGTIFLVGRRLVSSPVVVATYSSASPFVGVWEPAPPSPAAACEW